MSIKDLKKDILTVDLDDDDLATIISSLLKTDDTKLASKLVVLKAKNLLSYERGE